MRSFKTEGIIIKRRNYGEADRTLTVLTKYHGKIVVKATGVRRIPSRRCAHVELLNYSVLGLYKGRGTPLLTEANTIENFENLKNDLVRIGYAYHICELIDGLCAEGQENNRVFDLLKNTFDKLSLIDTSLVSSCVNLIHEFEIELLTILGFLPAGRQGWNNNHTYSYNFDTRNFIENILERKLKSRDIFSRLD